MGYLSNTEISSRNKKMGLKIDFGRDRIRNLSRLMVDAVLTQLLALVDLSEFGELADGAIGIDIG